LIISIGAFFGAFAFVWGLGTILYTILAGKRVLENNYWGEGATTLEWTLTCPPQLHSFERLPQIS
jgi:cytochrome c oxidase subunit 1